MILMVTEFVITGRFRLFNLADFYSFVSSRLNLYNMIVKQPKKLLTVIAALSLVTIIATSCNNSADTAKAGTDTTKADSSKMVPPPPIDTSMKKADTTKMDTAATRPIKATN